MIRLAVATATVLLMAAACVVVSGQPVTDELCDGADNNGDPYALPDFGFYYMANDDFNGITSANAVAWKASSSGLTFDGSDLALSGGTLMARLPMRSSDHHVNAAIVQLPDISSGGSVTVYLEALTTANTLAAVVTETAIDVVRVTDGAASTLGTVAYTWAADDVFLLQRVGSSLIAAAYTEVTDYSTTLAGVVSDDLPRKAELTVATSQGPGSSIGFSGTDASIDNPVIVAIDLLSNELDVDDDGELACPRSGEVYDCSDTDDGVTTGSVEDAEDDVDNDCDGVTDEESQAEAAAWTSGITFLSEDGDIAGSSARIQWIPPQLASDRRRIRGTDVLDSYLILIERTGGASDDHIYPIPVTDPDVFVDYTYRLEAIDREYTFPNLVPNTEYTVTLYAKTRSAFDGSYAVSTGETTTFTTPENTNADDAVPYPDVSAPVLEQDSGVLSWAALDLTGLPVALSLVAYEVGVIEVDTASPPVPSPGAHWLWIRTTGTGTAINLEGDLESGANYVFTVRGVAENINGDKYYSDIPSGGGAGAFDKGGFVGYREGSTSDYLRCSANGDTAAFAKGVADNPSGRCVCSSGYAPEGNGVFGVGPVEACNLEISNICLNPSTPTDEIIVEPGVGEANDGNLEFLIYASINRGGYVSRISFGDTGACNYPGPHWTKRLDASRCSEALVASIPITEIVSYCGIEAPIESDAQCPDGYNCGTAATRARRDLRQTSSITGVSLWLAYVVDMEVTTVEMDRTELEDPDDVGPVRVTQKVITTIASVPAVLVLSLNAITVTSEHGLSYLVVAHEWVPSGARLDQGSATITLQTSVQWPYQVASLAVAETADSTFVAASVAADVPAIVLCDPSNGVCIQQWSFVVEPEIACSFDDSYAFSAAFSCRDAAMAGGSCTTDAASFEVDTLDSISICSIYYRDDWTTIEPSAAAKDSSCVAVQSSFYLGETMCLEVSVDSSLGVDVDFDYAVAYLATSAEPTAIPLDTIDVADPSNAVERVTVPLVAAAFPATTVGETDTYVILATVSLTYDDGSRTRAARAVGGSTSTLSVALIHDATTAGGGGTGGAGGLDGTASTGTTPLSTTTIVIGACAAVVLVAFVGAVGVVVLRRRDNHHRHRAGGKHAGHSTDDDASYEYYAYDDESRSDEAAESHYTYTYEERTNP